MRRGGFAHGVSLTSGFPEGAVEMLTRVLPTTLRDGEMDEG